MAHPKGVSQAAPSAVALRNLKPSPTWVLMRVLVAEMLRPFTPASNLHSPVSQPLCLQGPTPWQVTNWGPST